MDLSCRDQLQEDDRVGARLDPYSLFLVGGKGIYRQFSVASKRLDTLDISI